MTNTSRDIDGVLTHLLRRYVKKHTTTANLESKILHSIKNRGTRDSFVWLDVARSWQFLLPVFLVFLLVLGGIYWMNQPSIDMTVIEGHSTVRLNGQTKTVNDRLQIRGKVEVDTLESKLMLDLNKASRMALDTHTQLRVAKKNVFHLQTGRLFYHHEGDKSPQHVFHTPFGTVRPLGTQFEMQLDRDSLALLIYEGKAKLRTGENEHQLQANERLTLGSTAPTKSILRQTKPTWYTPAVPWVELLPTHSCGMN